MTELKLNNGVLLPRIGLGLYKTSSQAEMSDALACAWEEGYRLFDTAAMYQNEAELAQAIRELALPRAELFITTKIWNDAQREDRVAESFAESLKKLDMDYVDLLLLHWPVREKAAASWAVLEALYERGLVRAIGVANFLQKDLEALKLYAKIPPAVNQIELHPRLNQRALVRYCQAEGIAVQAHSTIMRGRLLDNELLTSIAAYYGKSSTQVILRWHLQNGVAVIPKSSKAARIRENMDILDFTLSEVDMAAIDALDNGERCCTDPKLVDF